MVTLVFYHVLVGGFRLEVSQRHQSLKDETKEKELKRSRAKFPVTSGSGKPMLYN
jgi:hypothetical protein